MTELTEAGAIEYIKNLALLEQEPDHQKAVIHLGPWSAFILVGALQLATRHPEMSPGQRELIGQIIDQLRPLFAGTSGEQLLRLGDDPAKDIDRGCQHPFGPHSPECPPGGHAGFTRGEEGDGGLPSFTCPDCRTVSYLRDDIANSYCGRCHDFKPRT